MKAFTARDDRTLRRSVVLYPTFLLFQVPILLLGFAAILHPTAPASTDQIVPHLLLELRVPAIVVGLFSAGALAAAMGGDAIAHAAASIAVRDGVVRGLGVQLDPLKERAWIRAVLVIVLAAGYVLAIGYNDSVVWLLLFAYGPITQLMPGLLAGLYSRRATAKGILAGLAGGIALSAFFAFRKDLRPWPIHEGIYGLALNVLLVIAVSALTRSRDRVRDEDFLRVAAQRSLPAPRG